MRIPAWLPILLGFVTAVGPISTDMYLPAFPQIEASLGARAGSAQITLATWFAGLAVGQITQGLLSDRFGRRGPLILGMAVYTLASAGCALSPSLFWLAAFRALAAFGGSAGMVIPRAIVRDLADGHAAARLMSRLILVMGAAPILAPTLGGLVVAQAGWQVIFWFTTTYGAICLLLVWRLLPDTLPPQHRVALNAGGLLRRYVQIATERRFVTNAAVGGLAMFGMFAYIAGSPVFIPLFALAPSQFGMLFGLSAACFITAAQVSARVLPLVGSSRLISIAVAVYVAATLALVVAAQTGWGGLPALVAPIMLSLFSMGFVLPNTAVGALSRHAARAATASSLMGTAQFALAALAGSLAGVLADGTARPFTALMLTGAVCALIADRLRPRP